MKPRSLVTKLCALTLAEWDLLLRALLLIWCAGAMLRIASLKRVRRLTRTLADVFSVVNPSRPIPVERILWAIGVAARRSIFGSTCLIRAVAGEALLRSYGYGTKLRVGGKRADRGFEAHAWIERDGVVLLGGPQSVTAQYTLFPDVDELTL